jgi:hypothetical protein
MLYAACKRCYIQVVRHRSLETSVYRSTNRLLFVLLGLFAVASLIHFVHNAEYLNDYPGPPASWSRGAVYIAWLAMTAVGGVGALLVYRGYELLGLILLALYAALGLDSLGHYVMAPLPAHTAMMNSTILLEVGAAGLVLLAVALRLYGMMKGRWRERAS